MNHCRSSSGFTLIELMIVIAILAILLALAIPAYQDSTIRAQVAECIQGAASAKVTVSEYAISRNGTLPADRASAGFANFQTAICEDLDFGSGHLTVTVRPSVVPGGFSLHWTPSVNATNLNVDWDCSVASGPPKYAPAQCRG